MKLNSIKSLMPAIVLALSMGFVSCTKDLDVNNINPKQTSTLDTDALLNKIYSSFVLTGQQGPDGNKDIADLDEGRSDLFRKSWEMNEFPSEEASWQWDDTGLPELLRKTWGADNASSVGLYYRLFFSITLCNSYLDNVPEDGTGGMISFNHYASGAVGDFLYRRILGLEAIKPGYETFKVQRCHSIYSPYKHTILYTMLSISYNIV